MDIILKLNSQTAGRDKQARLLQYTSRFLWYRLQQCDSSDLKQIDFLKKLEFILSTFRKLLRFGRCVEPIYSSLKNISHPNVTIRLTLTLSKLSNALFLFADHLLYLSRSGLVNVNVEKWSQISNKYWLISLIMNLLRDLYEIREVFKHDKILCTKCDSWKQACDVTGYVFRKLKANHNVVLDTVKNGCDFWIPLTALGYTRLSPGTIGMLGLISSLVGMVALIDPTAKMVPS